MKTSSPCTFYFVALAVFESVAGMKEGKVLRFRDNPPTPMNFLCAFSSPVSFNVTISPAFERHAILEDESW